MQKRIRHHFARTVATVAVIALGIFLIIAPSVHVDGLDKETALLKKYEGLSGLAEDIRSGKIDFNDFGKSDGLNPQVMKNSKVYDSADASTKKCLDFAGKLGNSLGDHEIVHCFDDSNYFRNKYADPRLSAGHASSDISLNPPQDTSSRPSLAKILDDIDDVSEKLIKTGKFTMNEAKEFAVKIKQKGVEIKRTNTDNGNTTQPSEDIKQVKTTVGVPQNGDLSTEGNLRQNPDEYDDLGQLVRDIQNKNLDADKISLTAFQNSGAYQGSDEKTQSCIDIAGKIGHNLRDNEIVHCFEDPNYFKTKSSSKVANEVSSNNGSNESNIPLKEAKSSAMVQKHGNSYSLDDSPATLSDGNKNQMIEKLVKTGKFTEDEATEFVIVHELINNENFSEKDAISFAKNIMQSKNKDSANANSNAATEVQTGDTDEKINRGKGDNVGKGTVDSKSDGGKGTDTVDSKSDGGKGTGTVDSKSDDSARNDKDVQKDGASSSLSSDEAQESSDNKELIEKLLKTGKFTEDEAEKFAAIRSNGK